jgi:miniconductance mechanosensitive channel
MFKVYKIVFYKCQHFLVEIGFNATLADYISLFINIFINFAISYVIYFISRFLLVTLIAFVAKLTKTKFDDLLISNKTAKYISLLIPLVYVYKSVPIILADFTSWEALFARMVAVYIILLVLWIIRSVFNALRDHLKGIPEYSDKPIDSYIQVIMILLWTFGIIMIIAKIFDVNTDTLIKTLGAVSAVFILIFRDTILGFVASVQVSVNDLVRIGDWITMEKFDTDGDVIEINLATVKVRNFDNTTTTIPTYSLISDSFRNWRGMQNSGGRRIKRHVLIKSNSIRFIHEGELEKFKRIQLITSYIEEKQIEINNFNRKNNIDKSLNINGLNLTNFGIFRIYLTNYLKIYPGLNKDMMLLCRHLQPTSQGVPLEIYVFANEKSFKDYEFIMSDIFDHVLASVVYFDLEIFEVASNKNATSEIIK